MLMSVCKSAPCAKGTVPEAPKDYWRPFRSFPVAKLSGQVPFGIPKRVIESRERERDRFISTELPKILLEKTVRNYGKLFAGPDFLRDGWGSSKLLAEEVRRN